MREQVLQTVAIRNSVSENIGRIVNESSILASYSFPEFEKGLRSVESMENLFSIELESYKDAAAYSYIDFSGEKSITSHDPGEAGESAGRLVQQWRSAYRGYFPDRNGMLFVPPVVVSGGSVFLGLILPVITDGVLSGMLITVIDLVEPLDRYIKPIADEMSGTPVVVNSRLTILWDREARLGGRSLVSMLGNDIADIMKQNDSGSRRLLYGLSGNDASSVFFSWSTFNIEDERIAIAMISEETELMEIMDEHDNGLRILYVAVTLFFSAAAFVFIRYRFLLLKQELLEENQDKLEVMVEDRTNAIQTLLNRYTVLYESANDAISLLKDGVYIECNRKAIELFEADSSEAFIGKTPADMSPEFQDDGQRSDIKSAMMQEESGSGPPQVFVWQHRTLKGRVFHAEISLTTIDMNGTAITQAIVRDVSERVKSLREKDAMVKEIHHRVKNNLQIINSFLNLRQETLSDGEAYDVIVDTQRRVDVMAKAHEILYSQDDLSAISAAEYFSDILDFFRLQKSTDGKFELVSEFEDLPLSTDISMYAGFVLSELVDNAIRHGSDSGDVWVSIVLRKTGEQAELEVSDKGRGYTPEDGGSGLGLRIVSALESQLKGRISWSADNGTKVSFLFPLNDSRTAVSSRESRSI